MKKKTKSIHGMVDISQKDITKRTAVASAKIKLGKKAFGILMSQGSPKGDVFETAKISGIMAAKLTPQLIVMCHPLNLDQVKITFDCDQKACAVKILAEIVCWARTGVEMEALTAASVAALTIYDMMKWADKGMIISEVKLIYKSGGKSGVYRRNDR